MAKRQFELHFSKYGENVDWALIELDDAVIEAVDDEWRSMFHNLHTPEEIAKCIGVNLIVNHQLLSSLDGWANQPDGNARVLYWPDLTDWDVEVKERERR